MTAAKWVQQLGSFSWAAALALFSALLAIPAFFTAGVERDAISVNTSGTSVLKETFLDYGAVRKAYQDEVPRAVELAVKDFNQGATTDLLNDTQDYQTRYSPEVTCEEVKASVVAVYGDDACQNGSRFYQVSTQYERGLMIINSRGDPATSYTITLNGADLTRAIGVLRKAARDLVACVVKSTSDRPLTAEVSPASGYTVQGDKKFTLQPKGVRRVIIQPDEGTGGAAIGVAGCTVDYDLASQAKNPAIPRTFITIAGVLALGSFGVGLWGRLKGLKKDD
ncbi:hypothetical protein ABZX92_06795 [Lentzea sp. NPDC006480]|uniref:hypothetical protein n=1 Tax=Lentzea sp. NPDC006480 TaxID=3157176 RepID=UPI0033AFA01E